MNSTSILEQFVVKGKGASAQRKSIFTILVIITAVAFAGLIVFLASGTGAQQVAGSGGLTISANPELLVAQRYAAEIAARGETLFEIQNPELNLVMRLQQAEAAEADISVYPSPEVLFASRVGPDWIENPELNLLKWYKNYLGQVTHYKNPELMVAGRYAAGSSTTSGLTIEQKYAVMGVEISQPVSIYANPELGVVSRFAEGIEPVSYSQNPELMVAERFAQGSTASAGLTIEQKYAVMGVEASQPASVYDNPELNLVSRLASVDGPVSFSDNPELMVAGRYVAGSPVEAGLTIEGKYAVMGIEASQPVSIYANPELGVVSRFAEGIEPVSYSQNPELMVAERFAQGITASAELTIEQKYAVMGVEVSQPVSIYANPELGVVSRFASVDGPVSFSDNPELMVAGRYVAGSPVEAGLTIEGKYAVMGIEASQPVSIYANPELGVVSRFASVDGPVSFSDNPELMVAGRYVAGSLVEAGLTIEQKYAVMGIEASQPVSIYANPELGVVSRFASVDGPVSFSENPELMVAGRYVAGSPVEAGLTIEQKYAVMGVEINQPISIYANPEVLLAQRLAGMSEPVSLYPNPEVTLAQRFAEKFGAGSQGWAVNPELALAQRFTVQPYGGEFLSQNPEVGLHLKFVQGG